MVWHVSVLGELRGSGHGVLRHEITHVCSGDFLLVHVFLTVSPSLLSILLLLSEHMIIGLHVLELLVLLVSHLILKKTTHPGNSFGLLSIGSFLILERLMNALLLRLLILNPILLNRIVKVDAVAVVYKERKNC